MAHNQYTYYTLIHALLILEKYTILGRKQGWKPCLERVISERHAKAPLVISQGRFCIGGRLAARAMLVLKRAY